MSNTITGYDGQGRLVFARRFLGIWFIKGVGYHHFAEMGKEKAQLSISYGYRFIAIDFFRRINDIECMTRQLKIALSVNSVLPLRLSDLPFYEEKYEARFATLANSLSWLREMDPQFEEEDLMPLTDIQQEKMALACSTFKITTTKDLLRSMKENPETWEEILGQQVDLGLMIRCCDWLTDATDLMGFGLTDDPDQGNDDDNQGGLFVHNE